MKTERQEIHSRLLKFIEDRGRFVDEYVPDDGLTNEDAREFLGLLRLCEVRPLGIELWRHTAHGYVVDGTRGWYAVAAEAESSHLDAIAYMSSGWLGRDDLSVFQY